MQCEIRRDSNLLRPVGNLGMAKPRYIPRMNDTVTVEGVNGRFVVVGVDASTKTALVQTTTTPPIVQRASWTTLSYLDESQNAARIVREATEPKH
jgi:hypothetical protein